MPSTSPEYIIYLEKNFDGKVIKFLAGKDYSDLTFKEIEDINAEIVKEHDLRETINDNMEKNSDKYSATDLEEARKKYKELKDRTIKVFEKLDARYTELVQIEERKQEVKVEIEELEKIKIEEEEIIEKIRAEIIFYEEKVKESVLLTEKNNFINELNKAKKRLVESKDKISKINDTISSLKSEMTELNKGKLPKKTENEYTALVVKPYKVNKDIFDFIEKSGIFNPNFISKLKPYIDKELNQKELNEFLKIFSEGIIVNNKIDKKVTSLKSNDPRVNKFLTAINGSYGNNFLSAYDANVIKTKHIKNFIVDKAPVRIMNSGDKYVSANESMTIGKLIQEGKIPQIDATKMKSICDSLGIKTLDEKNLFQTILTNQQLSRLISSREIQMEAIKNTSQEAYKIKIDKYDSLIKKYDDLISTRNQVASNGQKGIFEDSYYDKLISERDKIIAQRDAVEKDSNSISINDSKTFGDSEGMINHGVVDFRDRELSSLDNRLKNLYGRLEEERNNRSKFKSKRELGKSDKRIKNIESLIQNLQGMQLTVSGRQVKIINKNTDRYLKAIEKRYALNGNRFNKVLEEANKINDIRTEQTDITMRNADIEQQLNSGNLNMFESASVKIERKINERRIKSLQAKEGRCNKRLQHRAQLDELREQIDKNYESFGR